jgi:hypothetical protein
VREWRGVRGWRGGALGHAVVEGERETRRRERWDHQGKKEKEGTIFEKIKTEVGVVSRTWDAAEDEPARALAPAAAPALLLLALLARAVARERHCRLSTPERVRDACARVRRKWDCPFPV